MATAQQAIYALTMERDDTLNSASPTQIAVLGTLAEFHQDPLPYDLSALVQLVANIEPDLLCLDISPEQWQQQDFDELPAEYSVALIPLAAKTDLVVVPIGSARKMPRATAVGWRGWLIQQARWLLGRIQSTAAGPDAVNRGWRHDVGNWLYDVSRRLAGPAIEQAHREHIEHLSAAVLRTAADNPGNRILVVTNIQYCHHVRPQLKMHPGITEMSYTDL